MKYDAVIMKEKTDENIRRKQMINAHINLHTKHEQRVIISQSTTIDYYSCEIKG